MTDDAAAIARASYEAYARKDRAAIEELIAKDFHFTSPLDNRIDRATYFARCWPNSASIEGFDFIHLVPDGERVFVTYEGRSVNGRRFRNTEIVTVRGRQIVEAEVYFEWSLPHEAAPGGFLSDTQDQDRVSERLQASPSRVGKIGNGAKREREDARRRAVSP